VPVTAIIAALNEEERIAATIDAAFAAGVAEVIVCDGGSSDRTVAVAKQHGAKIIEGESMRAKQLNRGAALATHDVLVFLHADTLLPAGAADAIERVRGFGGFEIAFIEPGLSYVAKMINARTRFTREPWGDQAQFMPRAIFPGYREIAIMEDYALARRMKREHGSTLLPLAVRTSGRRFLRKGVVRTAMVNWLIIAAYHLGVSPERLARWYRR
jgi:rSAM/selenodomain-associated transferase 2